MQKERLSWEKFRGEGCCRDRLGEAEIYEWSKYVKKIPHVDKLVICHIDKTLTPGGSLLLRVIFLNGPNV